MKSTIIKTALLLAGMGGLLMAAQYDNNNWNWSSAPEIDAASAGTALALLGGAVLMIRGRKR
jgi:hypothetical protein